ncbi:hypothetical protein B0H10DRAFT_1414526 [Mycena sp. CBHHK59/15]|nr:hypothetical protein B0H10DRAFT_1414526 [Mycena sp. CBHHK59/15]
MASTDLGCAQNPDGSLRDASEIAFYSDPDDEVPIAGPSSSKIHPLFTQLHPLGKVAGSRCSSHCCSSRTSHPSARVTDPNNAESSTTAGKRKAEDTSTAPRKASRNAWEPCRNPLRKTPMPTLLTIP